MDITFLVLSRWDAEDLRPPDRPHAFISITDPGTNKADLKIGANCRGVLRQQFHDTDRHDERFLGVPLVPIDDEQAQNIADFFRSTRELVDLYVIHCEAGISRSAGAAAALAKIHDDDDTPFFNGPYAPNMLVYRKVLEAYHAYDTQVSHLKG